MTTTVEETVERILADKLNREVWLEIMLSPSETGIVVDNLGLLPSLPGV